MNTMFISGAVQQREVSTMEVLAGKAEGVKSAVKGWLGKENKFYSMIAGERVSNKMVVVVNAAFIVGFAAAMAAVAHPVEGALAGFGILFALKEKGGKR